MRTSVGLQQPLPYPAWVPVAGAALALAALAALFVMRYVLTGRIRGLAAARRPKAGPGVVTMPFDLNEAKWRYMSRLDALLAAYGRGEVDTRVAHEEISRVVRSFVREATDIDVDEWTLADARRSPWPQLAELIAICYEPEFAEHPVADPRPGIEHAKAVIWSWR